MSEHEERRKQYWATNVRYVLSLLSIWFVVSYGCGILFVDQLDQIRLGGFKLGFWFAQQGAIYTFVLLIIAYVMLMNRLDRQLAADEAAAERSTQATEQSTQQDTEQTAAEQAAQQEPESDAATDEDEEAGA